MKITRRQHMDGGADWFNDRNNGFVSVDKDGRWWCEDHKGSVYGFSNLVTGSTQAPAYLRKMAKRAQRDTTT